MALDKLNKQESTISLGEMDYPLPLLKKAKTSPIDIQKTMDTLILENKKFKEIIEKFESEKKSQT